MKKIFLALLSVVVSCVSYAQNIKVHQGAYVNSYQLSDVDSIIHCGDEHVKIYINTQSSRYLINSVDSISISPEKIECYNIPKEQLNEWDEGVYVMSNNEDNFYIVSKKEFGNDGEERILICLNGIENEEADKTVNFLFDKNGNLQEIITSGYQFKAQLYLDEYIFIAYHDDAYVGSFNVPCEITTNNTIASGLRRRSPFFNANGRFSLPKIKDFASKASSIMKKSGDVVGIALNLQDGKYGDIMMSFVAGRLISLLNLPFALAIIAEKGIEGFLKYIYEQERSRLLGNSQIEITSIKRVSETAITVEGSIYNRNSIPSTLLVASEYYNPMFDACVKEIPNIVYWGIAEGNSGQPGLYLNDNSSGILPISKDKFSYTFYLDRVSGQVLYFRPFLAPKATLPSDGELPNVYTCIRYGESRPFLDMDIDLYDYNQISCQKDNGKYNIKFVISGRIPGLFQEMSGWGIEVKSKSESYWWFYAKETEDYYPPLEKEFVCEIAINDDEIIKYDCQINTSEITITPFVTFWNSLPPRIYLEGKDYKTFITDTECPDNHHPHWIDLGFASGYVWKCCNEGASSPAEYGNYYGYGEIGCSHDPDTEAIVELRDSCERIWDGNGYYFVGKNGGKIYIPCAGYYFLDEYRNYFIEDVSFYPRPEYIHGPVGMYWTSNRFIPRYRFFSFEPPGLHEYDIDIGGMSEPGPSGYRLTRRSCSRIRYPKF